jgi:hypothetical protein
MVCNPIITRFVLNESTELTYLHRDLGLEVTLKDRNRSIIELGIFQRCFKENILALDDKTASTTIMIPPVGTGVPVYRDIVAPFVKRYGIDSLNLAALLRVPQLVVPSMWNWMWLPVFLLSFSLANTHSFDVTADSP